MHIRRAKPSILLQLLCYDTLNLTIPRLSALIPQTYNNNNNNKFLVGVSYLTHPGALSPPFLSFAIATSC